MSADCQHESCRPYLVCQARRSAFAAYVVEQMETDDD